MREVDNTKHGLDFTFVHVDDSVPISASGVYV